MGLKPRYRSKTASVEHLPIAETEDRLTVLDEQTDIEKNTDRRNVSCHGHEIDYN